LLTQNSISKINQVLEESGQSISIEKTHEISGGCINQCYKIETNRQPFFLKVNESTKYPNMFKIEADSLLILSKTNAINTPEVIAQFEHQNHQYLLLEWIEDNKTHIQFWKQFAEDLAELHQQSATYFGLHFDNYIGSVEQHNTFLNNWEDFYIEQRIQPQVELAFDQNRISKKNLVQFEYFYNTLTDIFPYEKPALIHGDLWSGNFLCNQNKQVVLIDPSIYYSNREMEIAFTKLFGGFHPTFYEVYQEIYPLEKDFGERVPIYNLYSLLVHLNLFGGLYYNQVIDVLNRF